MEPLIHGDQGLSGRRRVRNALGWLALDTKSRLGGIGRAAHSHVMNVEENPLLSNTCFLRCCHGFSLEQRCIDLIREQA